MYTLKIKITKEILLTSRLCSSSTVDWIGSSCAVALAVRDIFPAAYVNYDNINPFFSAKNFMEINFSPFSIPLPKEAIIFIQTFDALSANDRCELPELEFEINIPDEVIEQINIDEIKPLLENHHCLELINS